MNTSTELAFEFFKVGNGITAFYIVQTLLFLNAIYKERTLLVAICLQRKLAGSITWFVAAIYITVVLGCFGIEIWLRYTTTAVENENTAILVSCVLAAIGRSCLIAIVAWSCTQLINKYLNVPQGNK